MHTVRIGWSNIQRVLSRRKKNVLISRKIKTGATIKHHWAIIEWACNDVRGPWSRKENILAILVAGANRKKKQVNCVKQSKGNKDERAFLIYTLNTWQGDVDSPARSDVTFCFERNSEKVEKSFRRNQVTQERLAMAFKVRYRLLVISLILL